MNILPKELRKCQEAKIFHFKLHLIGFICYQIASYCGIIGSFC